MRKEFPVLLVLLMSVGAFAQYSPAPIAVQIATYDTNPIPVKITNVNNGYVIEGSVLNQVVFDEMAGVLPTGYPKVIKGNTIRVEVSGVKQEQIYNEAPMTFSFDFMTGVSQPVQFTVELLVAIVVVFAATLGISIKIIKKKYTKDGKTVAQTEIYVTETGEKKHRHRNITGLHSPDTMHKYQPHKKGQLMPKYSYDKNAEGKYDYIG